MEEDRQIPFAEVLDLLFTLDSVPIQHLYRLSDLTNEQFSDFALRWPVTSDDRRIEISRHMSDLSEDNFVVDFVPIFAFMLADKLGSVRQAALDGLWDCEDENLVEPIINLMMEDTEVDVRAAAARSLAHFLLMSEWGQVSVRKSVVIFDALRAVYEDQDSALPVKAAALEAMGPFAHPQVSSYIEESYEGSVPELQRSAVFAMGTSADPRWLPLLIDEMESPYADMRAEAARAVGSIGNSESISQLSELIYDEDVDVAQAAIGALAQIGSGEANRVLETILSDESMAHLHEAAEEGLEESVWMEGELELFPWTDEDFEESSDLNANSE